jgi:pimeloyl-ACP methyl ester carboxylesterase
MVEHFLLTPAELQLVLTCRGDANRCGMALLLKTISHLGYVPDPMPQIPEEVRAFVAGQLGLLWDSSDAYTWHGSTLDYHLAQIRQHSGWRFPTAQESHLQFDSAARKRLVLTMRTTISTNLAAQPPGYVGLQREMHHALRAQHPEWITPNGECPTCDSYEGRLAQLLSLSPGIRALARIKRMKARSARAVAVFIATLVAFTGCASTRVASSDHLRRDVAAAELAYRELAPNHTGAYNAALNSIARNLDLTTPAALRAELSQAGVKIAEPAVDLPLVRYHSVRRSLRLDMSLAVGAPVVLEYDTSHASIYPRDGIFLSATAIYQPARNQPRLSFIADENSITLGRSTYPLVTDKTAADARLLRSARGVARSGLANLLHPDVRAKAEIVLTAPYDPNKIPILLVHGLQSTPLTFLKLVTTLESDPQIARHYQFWHFYYSTGTPVLLNALRLREQLERTVRIVDPNDDDFATKRIIVIGHSMGGLLAHTLVSSSGDHLWKSLFVVPPERLRGNPETIRRFRRGFFFRRNPRIVRAIFVSTPHRGSAMADSWIGGLVKSLIRLQNEMQNAVTEIAEENAEVRTAAAAAFHKQLTSPRCAHFRPASPYCSRSPVFRLACLFTASSGKSETEAKATASFVMRARISTVQSQN